jgi:hypothetical protein
MNEPIKLEKLLQNLLENNDLKSIKIVSKNKNILDDYVNILTGLNVDIDFEDIIYYDNSNDLNMLEAYSYKFIVLQEEAEMYKVIDKTIIDYPRLFFNTN